MHEAAVVYRAKEARDEELRILREKERSIRDDLEKLGNLSAIEREAKERFNLKRPGETVVVVVPDRTFGEAGAPLEETFFQRILLFFNSFF